MICVSDVFFGTIRYDKKIKNLKKKENVLKCSKLIFNVHSQSWLVYFFIWLQYHMNQGHMPLKGT